MFKVRRWLRWLVLLPLGLLGWALAGLLWFGPRWVERELPVRLAAALGDKTVTIGAVESDLLRLSFRVRDLSIKTADGRETFSCPNVWVAANWSSLLGEEKEVTSVRLEGPVVRLRQDATGWLSDWRTAPAEGPSKPLRIKGIELLGGTVELSPVQGPPVVLKDVEAALDGFDSGAGVAVKLSTALASRAKLSAEGSVSFGGGQSFRAAVRGEGLMPGDVAAWAGTRTNFWRGGILSFSAKLVSVTSAAGTTWSLEDGEALVQKAVLQHLTTLHLRADTVRAAWITSSDLSQNISITEVKVAGGGLFGSLPDAAPGNGDSTPATYRWMVGKTEWSDFGVSLATGGERNRQLALEKLHATLGPLPSDWEGKAHFFGRLLLPSQPWTLSGGFAGGTILAEGRADLVALRLRDTSLGTLRPWLSLPDALEKLDGIGSLGVTLFNDGNRWKGYILGELSNASFVHPSLGLQQASYVRVGAGLEGPRGEFTPSDFTADVRARGVRVSLRRNRDQSHVVPWSAFTTGTGATRWSLGRLILEDAEIDHDDQGAEPAFRGVWQLHGEIGPAGAEGHRDFEARGGLAGNAGVFRLKGNAAFGNFSEHLQLDTQVNGFDLRPFSAWSSHYAGRPLLGGTLDASATATVEKGKLKATNDLRFQGLSFGPPARKELATDVPVARMASLLRDRRDVVKLSLPVEGDLAQPNFHYSSLMWAALRRTSTRVLTAPLRALGELFSEDPPVLGEVERMKFEPAQTDVPASAKPLLSSLASFLVNRPGISLVISGGAAHAESNLLRTEALRMMVEDSLGRTPRTFEEYERGLRAEFEKAFPGELRRMDTPPNRTAPPASPEQPKSGFWARLFGRKAEAPALPVLPVPPQTPAGLPGTPSTLPDPSDPLPPEMEERLLETIVVPISALDELAVLRARSVRSFLVAAGVEASRLKVVEHSTENAATVRLRLP